LCEIGGAEQLLDSQNRYNIYISIRAPRKGQKEKKRRMKNTLDTFISVAQHLMDSNRTSCLTLDSVDNDKNSM